MRAQPNPFRTRASPRRDGRDAEFRTVHHATVELLSAHGVLLVGIDTPSIDPKTARIKDAHRAARQANMRVLEGLLLNSVAAGDYELIALPLSFVDPDDSPVRAILRDLV